ncbi:MAG: hypothetical protein M1165_02885, partial [Candidatus Pacearchaeota archaeon]|nr:hypothetical protein [Candidatus Pacearchaeota archaeon]
SPFTEITSFLAIQIQEGCCIHNIRGINVNHFILVSPAPLVFTNKGKFACNFERISSSTKLKILEGPIHEYRDDSIVGRDIIVLSKLKYNNS